MQRLVSAGVVGEGLFEEVNASWVCRRQPRDSLKGTKQAGQTAGVQAH